MDQILDEFGKRRITPELPQTIIEHTSCVLIFITENYLNKVNGEDITDHCQRDSNLYSLMLHQAILSFGDYYRVRPNHDSK